MSLDAGIRCDRAAPSSRGSQGVSRIDPEAKPTRRSKKSGWGTLSEPGTARGSGEAMRLALSTPESEDNFVSWWPGGAERGRKNGFEN